ncbi:MAG: YibE/F family protein [Syntrophomonadaceae bacterium]|nr:YibE/F family protein [Syntrophomonadaceae bacterium]MDD4549180.1 YibE/F family protein [Syntrophomonadaceae bacterium]
MKSKIKHIFILLLLFFIFIPAANVNLAMASTNASGNNKSEEMYVKARVIKVNDVDTSQYHGDQLLQEQIVKVEILNGKFEGKIVEARNTISGSHGWNIKVKPDDKVILCVNEEGKNIGETYIYDIARAPYVIYLLLLLVLCLIMVGRRKGITSLVVLGITIIAVYGVLLPSIIKGCSPIISTVLVMSGVTLLTIIITCGMTRKSLAAIFGTLSGALIAGILAIVVGQMAHLTGFMTDGNGMLLYIENLKIDMQGLLFASILISGMGGIINIAISIVLAVEATQKVRPDFRAVQLIRTGMDAGRGIMGTTLNTLVLAYTGGALPVFLLYIAYNSPGMLVFNAEFVVTEIVRAVAGGVGLSFTIPVTAFFAGILNGNKKMEDTFTSSD